MPDCSLNTIEQSNVNDNYYHIIKDDEVNDKTDILLSKSSSNTQNKLNVLQINIQCIRNKILEIEHFCELEKIDVICISEHWLKEIQVNHFVPFNFKPASVVCRGSKKNGGVGIYTDSKLHFSVINLETFYLEIHFELCGIKIIRPNGNLNIISIYRSPSGDIKTFFSLFESVTKRLLRTSEQLIICGDFNINFIDKNDRNTKQFFNLARSLNLTCTNMEPTRGAHCIDNILVNFSSEWYESKVVGGFFGDHDPVVIKIFLKQNNFIHNNKSNRQFKRSQSEQLILKFIKCLEEETWHMIEDYKLNRISVSDLFDNFYMTYINLWHYCSFTTCLEILQGS